MTITIGLPSKGRMKEEASDIFERAGLRIVAVGNDRSYRGRVEGWDVPHSFAAHVECLAAGHEQVAVRALLHDQVDELGDCGEEVLGVVENDQRRPAAKARQGAGFDLRAFHRQALDLGSLGLDPLRKALGRL